MSTILKLLLLYKNVSSAWSDFCIFDEPLSFRIFYKRMLESELPVS